MKLLTKNDFTEKQLVFLRWLSRTIGGVISVESKETALAHELEKRGMITLLNGGHAPQAQLTFQGYETLQSWGWSIVYVQACAWPRP